MTTCRSRQCQKNVLAHEELLTVKNKAGDESVCSGNIEHQIALASSKQGNRNWLGRNVHISKTNNHTWTGSRILYKSANVVLLATAGH